MSKVTAIAPRAQEPPAGGGVYVAIAAVMEQVGRDGIAKSRRNQQQQYQFRGIDDVYNALAPILAQNHLVIVPRVLSRERTEQTTAKGALLFYVVVQVEFQITYAPDGSSVTACTWGEAMDSGDKATNKAMSAAYKYMAIQTFCIPTEGDNDADATTHEAAAADRPASPSAEPQTVSKTDARADFSAMQEEIRNARSSAELREWGAINKRRKQLMPPDWQKELIDQYRDMLRGHQEIELAREQQDALEEIPL